MDENGSSPKPGQADNENALEPSSVTDDSNAIVGESEVATEDPMADALLREAELRDRLLRAVAETENIRRRAEREKSDALQYGMTRLARDLLSVLDSLQRALTSLDEETRAGASEPVKNLVSGIELTEKELLRVLAMHGIRPVDPKGEKFDPHLHQAIAQIPAPGAAEGTVIDVAQVGYTIGERLLRPAMVIVAAGGGPAGNTDSSEPGQNLNTTA